MVFGVCGAEKRVRGMSRHLFPFFFRRPRRRFARVARCVIKIQKLSGRIMMIARLLYDDDGACPPMCVQCAVLCCVCVCSAVVINEACRSTRLHHQSKPPSGWTQGLIAIFFFLRKTLIFKNIKDEREEGRKAGSNTVNELGAINFFFFKWDEERNKRAGQCLQQ